MSVRKVVQVFLVEPSPHVIALIKELEVDALIDSGCEMTCMSLEVAKAAGVGYSPQINMGIIDAQQGKSPFLGLVADLPVTIASITTHVPVLVHEKLSSDLILGRTWQCAVKVSAERCRR